jgi:hypothetical protein
MRRLVFFTASLAAFAALFVHSSSAREDKEKPKDKEEGFVSIFDGKSLKGWKISAESGHSSASKHKSGGKWYVDEKEKCICGTQDIKGNGGIIITEEKYGDFEVRLDMRNDFGPDSGLFLRSNTKGQAYQAMIDYHKGGNLMGVYGEGIGGFGSRNFTFLDKVTEIKEDKADFKLPVKPQKWAEFWKHGEWNELAARIEGNPPKITTWIKGVKFMEWKDDSKKERLPAKGGIALQIHGGGYGGPGDLTKLLVRYRNIRVKKLDK